MSSPPTMSFYGGEKELDKASKPVVDFQNNLSDDEEELCRICRTPAEKKHPLYYPCACKGSLKFTHEECHLKWLNYRSIQRGLTDEHCEICKGAFASQYVYAANTPSMLPLLELIRAIALKAARWLRVACELLTANFIVFREILILLSVLLFVIPFTTVWMWRLILVGSFSKAYNLIISRCTPSLIRMDWLYGISLVLKAVFRLDIGVLSKFVSDKVFERLRELWLERVRARRQLVVEVQYPWLRRIGLFVVKEIITPVLTRLLIALCVGLPLAFALWMFPTLGYPLVKNPAVDQYGWLAFLGVGALWYGGKRMKQWLSDLHDSIRNEAYSIGKKLHNFETTHEKSE